MVQKNCVRNKTVNAINELIFIYSFSWVVCLDKYRLERGVIGRVKGSVKVLGTLKIKEKDKQ